MDGDGEGNPLFIIPVNGKNMRICKTKMEQQSCIVNGRKKVATRPGLISVFLSPFHI